MPKNVLERGIRCPYGSQFRESAERLGLPSHGAGQPFGVAEFLIKYLTEEGDLVIDPWGGRSMTGLAAEMLNRTWITGELALQYVRGAAELFRDRPGFRITLNLNKHSLALASAKDRFCQQSMSLSFQNFFVPTAGRT